VGKRIDNSKGSQMKRWSNAEFKFFKDRVMHWKRAFGLSDWDIVVKFADLKQDSIGAAATACHEARLAEILLNLPKNADSSRPNDRVTLDQWALHEVLHVLFTEFRWYTVHTEKEKITALEHAVIRSLENAILGDDR
jgi:hypothetical protein